MTDRMAQEVRIRQEQAKIERDRHDNHEYDLLRYAVQQNYEASKSSVETHSVIMGVFVIGLLACCLVILASLFSERLTQAILDARHDLAQWVIAYWSGR